jgi:hypothetical protein
MEEAVQTAALAHAAAGNRLSLGMLSSTRPNVTLERQSNTPLTRVLMRSDEEPSSERQSNTLMTAVLIHSGEENLKASEFEASTTLPAIASGKMAAMPDHPHTIDRWDDTTGENLIEQIAAVGDYTVALATYRAAVKRWPKDKITLRNRARVIEQSWRN